MAPLLHRAAIKKRLKIVHVTVSYKEVEVTELNGGLRIFIGSS